VKDVGFIVKYSSEQRLISFSENVSDRGNAVSAVSVPFAAPASQKGINRDVFLILSTALMGNTLHVIRFFPPCFTDSVH